LNNQIHKRYYTIESGKQTRKQPAKPTKKTNHFAASCLLTSLVEGVKTILLVTLVERVVDDGVSSTSTHLLEGSVGSTTGTSNEGNNADNNTSNDTSSKNSGGNRNGRNGAIFLLLDALRFRLDTLHSAAVSLSIHSVVATQRLIVATLESNTDSDGAEETVIGARDALSDAAFKSATVVLARILEVASDVIGSV